MRRREFLAGVGGISSLTAMLGGAQENAPCTVARQPAVSPLDYNRDDVLKKALKGQSLICSTEPPRREQFQLPEKSSAILPRTCVNGVTPESAVGSALMKAYSQIHKAVGTAESLKGQATLHGVACSSSPNVHQTPGLFLPWHRAFLYFHEKILQRTIPEFRLPYWDPQHLEHPCIYEQPDLFHLRDWSPVPGLEPLNKDLFNALAYPATSDYLGSHTLQSWHASIHTWVGGQMKDLSSAGLDPLFYAFHADVDRAWCSAKLVSTDKLPNMWARFWKLFPGDADGSWVWVNLQDFAHTERLGYKYDALYPNDNPGKAPFEYYFDFTNVKLPASEDNQYTVYLSVAGKGLQALRTFTGATHSDHNQLATYPFMRVRLNDEKAAALAKSQGRFYLLGRRLSNHFDQPLPMNSEITPSAQGELK